ncbi:MAG: multi-sensor hybrid histidine kinase, partial [Verrucomicrobiales bacterium]|nr:multi-sensor hybrid histidine kinase [Verrucomicrobiales bacterium]
QVGRMLAGEIPTYQMEKRYFHKNGNLVWALLSVSLIHDEAGKPLAFISQIQDITERKIQERNKNSFYNLGRRLNTAHNAREAADTIVSIADELFAWDAATVFLYSPDEELVQVVLTIDTIDGKKVECKAAYDKEKPSKLSRQAIEQGAMLILRPAGFSPVGDSVMFGDTSRPSASLMFAPIRDGIRVIGILSVQSYTRLAFTEADLETLQSLADYCGGALNRIQAEQKRKSSEEGFRALAESMPQIVWITRADGWNIYFNQRWMDFTGLTLLESIGNGWSRPFHPDERAHSEAKWRKAISTRGEYSLEARLQRKDGVYRWMLVRALPLSNADGEIVNWFGTCTDIDDLKKALDAVRESEERFRLFANVTTDAIWDWDLQTGEMWWNEGFTKLFGYDRAEVEKTSASWENRIDPKDSQRVVGSIYEVVRGSGVSWTSEYNFTKKDGSSAFVLDRGHVIRDREGKALRMIGGMTDLSGRRDSEEKLKEQAALLDQTSDAVLVRGLDHEILFWNKGAEKIYGWAAPEVLGKSVRDVLYRDPSQLDAAMDKVVAGGEWAGELSHVTRSGTMVSIYGRWTLMRDLNGNPKSVLAINTDITERKKLEQQFLRSQRMESIGTLAGGIAHDLNNVLAPILLSIELLKNGENRPDKLETLNTIENSARRGADMVKQVLSFARGVAGRRVDVQVDELLQQLDKIINETFLKNIEVKTTVSGDLLSVTGDPTQLHQVLLNLCVNARDAMPEGGVLRLSADNVFFTPESAARILHAAPGDYVLIKVEDNGTGISPAILDKIFDPFFTTKDLGKGTGLGLSTSQAIVRSHSGFMQVQTNVGSGATFLVYLPAHKRKAVEAIPVQGSHMARGTGQHILVVDDEDGVRVIVRKILESFGYKVSEASDGEEAIAVYKKHKQQISLVLTDMMMPMMDGPATIEALKKLNPSVRIIAASGLSVTETVASASNLGVRHFLPKPFTTLSLLEMVKKALQES